MLDAWNAWHCKKTPKKPQKTSFTTLPEAFHKTMKKRQKTFFTTLPEGHQHDSPGQGKASLRHFRALVCKHIAKKKALKGRNMPRLAMS